MNIPMARECSRLLCITLLDPIWDVVDNQLAKLQNRCIRYLTTLKPRGEQ